MKQFITYFVFFLVSIFTSSIIAQEFGSVRGGCELKFPQKIQKLVLDPLPVGTYSVGNGGYFPTIDSAFNKLGLDGIAGEVILELIDDLYTAPTDSFGFHLVGPIPGANLNSRVTIKPVENKNVTIEGNGYCVMTLTNTSFVTMDGTNLTGSTTLTFHNNKNSQFLFNDCLDFLYNSDHNIIQNINFICEDYNGYGGGLAIWTPSNNPAVPDSNLIQNNFIPKAGFSIYVSSYATTTECYGNIIRGNIIGTETDSLINWGIQVENGHNTVIENNIVQNIKAAKLVGEVLNVGINSFSGNGDIIRNNVVYNMKCDTGYTCTGILLSGGTGTNNMIYNNMIFDIQSSASQSNSRVAGIQIWSQSNPKIYYNSVYLSGTGNGANPFGSAALLVYGGFSGSSDVDLKNNIFVNSRDESPYGAYSIYDYNIYNLTSDYNVFYYDDTNSNNCLVRLGPLNYFTLEEWQQAYGKDLNSYVEMPHFDDPYLHIDSTFATYIESRGIPISGITNDFDGDPRNISTPDIGADELNGIVGVEEEVSQTLTYGLEQNYPNPFNPSTIIKYSIPQTSKVQIKVFDVLGNEIKTLVNEEKPIGSYELNWNAANLPSGVYFYQLKAGSFVETKKMVLLK